ncbi:MAG: hypothetical protein M0024_09410 [Nitrospiraceae bacterium]|nr:hypothetical protein [Nitrospiraceae bacterium]
MIQAAMKTGIKTFIPSTPGEKKVIDILASVDNSEEVKSEEAIDTAVETKRLLADLRKYLSSSAFYDVGPVTSRRIVTFFGVRTPLVIQFSLHELLQVTGVGRKRMLAIQRGWEFQRNLIRRSDELTGSDPD